MSDIDQLLSLNAGREQSRAVDGDAASPLLVSSTSMNVKPIVRPDASTQAPGPTLHAGGVALRQAKNAVAPNSRTSPAGAGIVGSSGGMP